MSTIIICAFVVVIVALICEVRLMRADKEKLRLNSIIKDREKRIEALADVGFEILDDLRATYLVLLDKLEDDNEDIDLLILEKKIEMLREEE